MKPAQLNDFFFYLSSHDLKEIIKQIVKEQIQYMDYGETTLVSVACATLSSSSSLSSISILSIAIDYVETLVILFLSFESSNNLQFPWICLSTSDITHRMPRDYN